MQATAAEIAKSVVSSVQNTKKLLGFKLAEVPGVDIANLFSASGKMFYFHKTSVSKFLNAEQISNFTDCFFLCLQGEMVPSA